MCVCDVYLKVWQRVTLAFYNWNWWMTFPWKFGYSSRGGCRMQSEFLAADQPVNKPNSNTDGISLIWFFYQDGRLQEGDKIVSINGRPAWCLTCGQVARCLRQNDTVILGIHRADRYDRYDYMNSSLYCGSSRRSTMRDSVSSDSPRSISSSTSSSDSQVC